MSANLLIFKKGKGKYSKAGEDLMLEKIYKYLLWLFIVWFLVNILLITFHVTPPHLTTLHSLFLMFTGVFALGFFVLEYGTGLGLAMISLVFIVSVSIEWMQLSFTEENYAAHFGLDIYGIPVTFGFIWVGMIAGTHVIAREITLKIRIDWLRGAVYAIIAATMVMIFEVLIQPISLLSKNLMTLGSGVTVLQLSDFISWWLLGFILHLLIFFILSLTDKWEKLKYPDLKLEMVIVYWIIIAFFVFLSLYINLWSSIAIIIGANALFTLCFYIGLDKEEGKM